MIPNTKDKLERFCLILKSNSLAHLHAAVNAGMWAFRPRADGSKDQALLSYLQPRVERGMFALGVCTDANSYGAYIYGVIRGGPVEGDTRDIWWNGVYNFPIRIDWQYLNHDRTAIDKQTLRSLYDLRTPNGTGCHMPGIIPFNVFQAILLETR